MRERISIFCSYAHEDERLRKKLEAHLALLQQKGLITTWYDHKIRAGVEWANEISSHLNKAQVILLLVSPSFLASDYCYGTEMMQALARHDAGVARVIPVILRPVYWQGAPFSKLEALPTDARPITGRSWHNLDEAFANVAQGIHKIVEELCSQSTDIHEAAKLNEVSVHKGQMLSSCVVLVDASLDPHDSPYEQTIENGIKKIRHKGI